MYICKNRIATNPYLFHHMGDKMLRVGDSNPKLHSDIIAISLHPRYLKIMLVTQLSNDSIVLNKSANKAKTIIIKYQHKYNKIGNHRIINIANQVSINYYVLLHLME